MTERKIQDYLGFYTGCEIMINPHDSDKRHATFIGFTGVDRLSALVKYRSGPDGRINLLFIKPILRPLSDMTEEEKIMLCCLNMPIGWQPGHIIQTNDDDIAAMRIFDHAGDYKSLYIGKGKISPKNFIWLLSKGFDLFNLIPDGLAIDKSTLKP